MTRYLGAYYILVVSNPDPSYFRSAGADCHDKFGTLLFCSVVVPILCSNIGATLILRPAQFFRF